MIQISQFPIIKSVYYEITSVLMEKNGGFHDTHLFSWHQKFGLVVEMDVTAEVATLIILCFVLPSQIA